MAALLNWNRLRPYCFAALGIAIAVPLRTLLDPLLGDKMAFVTMFPVVVISAWYGGFGPAVLATVLGSLGVAYFVLEPRLSFEIAQPEYRIGIVVNAVVCLALSLLLHSMRSACARAEAKVWQIKLREQELEHDAAKRLLVEQTLRESEQRFRGIFEQAAVGVGHTTLDRVILDVNPGLCRMLGYKRDELIGRRVTDVTHPDEQMAAAEGMRPLIAGEVRSVEFQRRFKHKGGHYVWTHAIASLLRDRDGKPDSVVSIVQDITERKQAVDSLKEADQRKDEFLATLAHELRNPLAPICNSLHILRLADGETTSHQDVIEMMERQVRHMVRLVDDLLEVSRITRGKIELRREPVELAAIVRSAVEACKPQLEAADHQLAITLPREPIILNADPVRLSQVFANLLNNAAKYTDPGGQIWLAVNVSRTKDSRTEIAVSVRDNGMGISPTMLPRVFDMFVQSDIANQRAKGGIGIGLTLVKKLVELHGGRVEAKSTGEGQGSEFTVHLPCLAEQAASSDEPLPPMVESQPGAVATSVLIVDDNRDAADSLRMVLQRFGASVRVVYDGPAALAMLKTFRPSLVLLDIGMPEMDGYEVLREAKSLTAHQAVTFVAVTGWGQDADRRRSKEAGFHHHLVKPVDASQLRTLLAAAGVGELAKSAS